MNRTTPLQEALFTLFSLFLLTVSCAVPLKREQGAQVSVKTVYSGKAVPGVTVGLYAAPSRYPGSPYVSTVTGDDGIALLSPVPRGRYFLLAAKEVSPGKVRFGYFGGNPLYLDGGELFLILPLVDYEKSVVRRKGSETLLTGRVVESGVPLARCYVFAFSDDRSDFRDPGDAVMTLTDDNGYFEMELSPGDYFVLAKKRKSGSFAGPLSEGDSVGYFPGNPLRLSEGETVLVTIPAVTLRMRNAPVYERKGVAVVEGIIVDGKGNPVRGVYAALYDNPDLLNRPIAISQETKDDGKFILHVPYPGKFYLGARTGYGGAPAPGDLYGRYEGTLDHSVDLQRGERVTGIIITVTEVW